MRSVTVGQGEGEYVEILRGVNGGERVIVHGWEKLKEGDRIAIHP
jgi:multidrug efflux pump subunit AcrA (membrane-fusion protein)